MASAKIYVRPRLQNQLAYKWDPDKPLFGFQYPEQKTEQPYMKQNCKTCDNCALLGQVLYRSDERRTKRICMNFQIFIPERSGACSEYIERRADDLRSDEIGMHDVFVLNDTLDVSLRGRQVKVIAINPESLKNTGFLVVVVKLIGTGISFRLPTCYLQKIDK